jgi:MoaA/NifB/PqqE/SkfB family radical SAM enzyme
MYLGMRGRVAVCCVNKSYLIGRFPDQSLEEIWFGDKLKRIREHLSRQDFSLGCQNCKEGILAGNYTGVSTLAYDKAGLPEQGYPTKIDFELDNTCNLECVMCKGEFSSAIRKNREKLPPIPSGYGPELLEQLKPFLPHLKFARFAGGEPFMVNRYLEIWELMARENPNIQVSIQTNGTFLTERIRKIMRNLKLEICISIDSVEKERYETIRKNANFEKVVRNIKEFRKYADEVGTPFHISYCPMTNNWEELPKVITFFNDLNCEVFFNTVDNPRHYALKHLPPEKLAYIHQSLSQVRLPGRTKLQRLNRQVYEQQLDQILLWSQRPATPELTTSSTSTETKFEAWLAGLETHVLAQNQNPKNRQLQFDSLQAKIRFIISEAQKEEKQAAAMRFLSAVDYETACNFVPDHEKEELMIMMRTNL